MTVLSNPDSLKKWVESRVVFLDGMTELIPEWKKVVSLPIPQGPEGSIGLQEMKKLRISQPVSLTAAALNALG